MSEPLVSVIVVNLDGHEHLVSFFEALETQTLARERFELILVDNGSTDGSVAYAQGRWPGIQVVRNAQNQGFAGPNNQAAAVAKGRYLAFVNNDMRLDPAWLETMTGFLDRTPEDVVCAGSRILSWDGKAIDFVGSGMAFNGMGFQLRCGEPATSVVEADWPDEILFACGGAMAIDREAYLAAGGFDESFFAYYEDVDLGWRLWVMGYRVRFCGAAVAYHRHNATSARFSPYKKTALLERNALSTLFKNYDDANLARFLPAAALLAFKRVAVRSGVDRGQFAFTLAPAAGKKPPGGLARLLPRLGRVMVRDGLAAFVRRAAIRLCEASLARLSGGARGSLWMNPDAYATVVALEDFIGRLPALLAARNSVQARRKRSDADIMPLFRLPLQPADGHPDYVTAHRTLEAALGLEAPFLEPMTVR